MTRLPLTAATIACLALTGCQTAYEQAATQIASADIMNRDGAKVGTARLFSLADEVTINVSLQGLSEGTSAVHLHTTGNCSASDFTSAGGHLNPDGNEHGMQNPKGAHLGDLPNAIISAEGTGTVSSILRIRRSEVAATIFDADGTALVVHAGADDNRSDPAGAAGPRIACGVFTSS